MGGTCQERARSHLKVCLLTDHLVMVRYTVDGKTYSFNCLFISMKSLQQTRIPLRMAVLNLVHELMHAFGAQHDPEEAERPECTPRKSEEEGRFLMSKFSNNGRKHNHELVSPCTRQAVTAVLRSESRAVNFTFTNIRIHFITLKFRAFRRPKSPSLAC